MLLSYNSNLTPLQIKKAILDNVTPLDDLEGIVATGGRLNAKNAIESIFGGDRAYSYKCVVKLNNVSSINSTTVQVEYDPSLTYANGFYEGDLCTINNGLSNSSTYYPNSVSYSEISYSNSTTPITNSGILGYLRFDCPFKSVNCMGSFSQYSFNYLNTPGYSTTPSVSLTTVLAGDANSSNTLNNADVTQIMNYIVGSISLNSTQIYAADVNCDGNINAKDVNAISKFLAGTRDSVMG